MKKNSPARHSGSASSPSRDRSGAAAGIVEISGVILEQIALGDAELGPEELFQIGEAQFASADFDFRIVHVFRDGHVRAAVAAISLSMRAICTLPICFPPIITDSMRRVLLISARGLAFENYQIRQVAFLHLSELTFAVEETRRFKGSGAQRLRRREAGLDQQRKLFVQLEARYGPGISGVRSGEQRNAGAGHLTRQPACEFIAAI